MLYVPRVVAKKATGLRRERSESAPIVTSVQLGETVVALTGVVVTERPGRATVVDPEEVGSDISGGSLELRPGDSILLLHYQGEGMWLAWSSGTQFSIFVRQNPGSFYAGEAPPDSLRIDSWPDAKWWIHIRTSTGKEGWTDQPDHFDGKDACS